MIITKIIAKLENIWEIFQNSENVALLTYQYLEEE
jgi:hypothetical protein